MITRFLDEVIEKYVDYSTKSLRDRKKYLIIFQLDIRIHLGENKGSV